MSDDLDLDDLKAAMSEATPQPDADRRAENLALAQKNFEMLQGSRPSARLSSEAPEKGLFKGVISMLQTFPARAALTASTAIVAVGLAVYLPSLSQGPSLAPPLPAVTDAKVDPEAEADGLMQDQLPDPIVELEVVAEELMAEPMASISAAPIAKMAPRQASEFPSPYITEGNTEAFPEADTNPLKVTSEEPVSTFSIDVDTASYSLIRNSLQSGLLPPKDAVRIEEMVNYFPYDYPTPTGDTPFALNVATLQTPWNAGTRLVHIGLQGRMPALETRPPLNLVFLIDTSGSMKAANKLPLLKQSFRLMLANLRPEDSVAIVTYAGSAGRVLDPTPASERETIFAALDQLHAGGSTAGQAGLQQAYATAQEMADEGEISRVILATDGDFNVGLSDPEDLKDYISDKQKDGTYLSVLGFGRGNLDDVTMQALAQNGNGQAAYIDTLNEAQKVLVDQLTGALFPIADDVKIQIEFNPAQVAEYRLIGYETRALRREDFNNDKVDAGEIGAGHSVTALYEITPIGSSARLTDPLRYGETSPDTSEGELGFLKLRYKAPGDTSSLLLETPIQDDNDATNEMRFAAAIAGFGQLLKDDTYLGDWSWGDAISLAADSKGNDPFGYRTEAVQLMRLAQSMSR